MIANSGREAMEVGAGKLGDATCNDGECQMVRWSEREREDERMRGRIVELLFYESSSGSEKKKLKESPSTFRCWWWGFALHHTCTPCLNWRIASLPIDSFTAFPGDTRELFRARGSPASQCASWKIVLRNYSTCSYSPSLVHRHPVSG
jgi:hypothetical protein